MVIKNNAKAPNIINNITALIIVTKQPDFPNTIKTKAITITVIGAIIVIFERILAISMTFPLLLNKVGLSLPLLAFKAIAFKNCQL